MPCSDNLRVPAAIRGGEFFQHMKPYLRITVWYLLFGALWICLTDRCLSPLSGDVAALTGWQTIKGWVYVFASGGLIFFLTKRASLRQELVERKRLEGFRRTVRQSHHILLNYFNQMQIFMLEAENSKDFDRNLIELAREITDKATAEVHRLEAGDPLTPGEKGERGKSRADQVHADDL